MFSKNWRAILVEVVRPEAPHWMILQTSHLLWTIIYFYKTPPSKGPVLYLIGEMKFSSSSSNYPFANLKSLNRTPKGKQTIIYHVKCQPSFTGLQGTLPDSVSVVYFNADLRPFRENRNRAPCHTWQLKLIYFWEQQIAYSRGSFQ